MQDFHRKVAVVTGAGSGIGLGVARALAAEGAEVVLADIDRESAEKAAEELREIGRRSLAVETDVTCPESVARLAASVVDRLGGVDVLINNAGVYLGGEMREMTESDWRFVLDVNVDGVIRIGQTFAGILRDQGRGGYIVNTASVAGFMARPRGAAYGVSKFGVVAYSEALRLDLEPEGIGVSTLCPGPIATNLPHSDRLRKDGDETSGASRVLQPMIENGMAPDDIGPIVLRGIRSNAPYIFTHDFREEFARRFDTVLAGFDALSETDAV